MADSPTLAELNAQFFNGFLRPTDVSPVAGGPAAVAAYTYTNLPAASSVSAGTQVRVTDWPMQPAKYLVSDGSKWAPPQAGAVRQHVSTRHGAGTPASTSNNATNQHNSFNQSVAYPVNAATSQLRMLFANTTLVGVEVVPGEFAVTLECSIEYPIGTKRRAHWEGGGVSKTLQPGEEAWLVADGLFIPAGDFFVLNTHGLYSGVPTGLPIQQSVMGSTGPYAAVEFNERGVGLPDKTMGTMPATRAFPNSIILQPKLISGVGKYAPTVVLLGDSNRGWAKDGLTAAGVRHVDWGNGSWSIAQLLANPTHRIKHFEAGGFTHVLVTMSGNDVSADKTGAQIIALAQQLAAILTGCGLIPIFCTTPPKTLNDNSAVRSAGNWEAIQTYNAWVKTNNGVGYGHFDLFSQWGNPSTGLWLTTLGATPSDGVHASAQQHAAAAAAFVTAAPALFK